MRTTTYFAFATLPATVLASGFATEAEAEALADRATECDSFCEVIAVETDDDENGGDGDGNALHRVGFVATAQGEPFTVEVTVTAEATIEQAAQVFAAAYKAFAAFDLEF